MYLTILLAIAALAISSVAAYFSVIGLATIFAASAAAIIIMGAAVECGKIISVAWIHYYWDRTSTMLRTIMISCIVVAMILTSVGVFGFLSKAHVMQTALGTESVAQIERIETEVVRNHSVIERAENKIRELEGSGSNTDKTVQRQISDEQARMDAGAERLQPAIDEQNAIIWGQTKRYEDQIITIGAELMRLATYIENKEIKKAQQLIGETSLGGWGPLTAETSRLWKLERTTERARLEAKIEDVSQNNLAILAARKEIRRLRQAQETQVAESNKLINRLRAKIGNSESTNVDELIDAQYERITKSNKSIETLTDEKYEIEAEFRQLEAEVGPIRYVAEFVYGEKADATMLEEAVKWMIILLLLVLDPFALALVVGATDGWKWHRAAKKEKFDADVDSGKIQFIEKIVEKIVEVPVTVEKIVEVERIVEVDNSIEDLLAVEKLHDELEETLAVSELEIEKIVIERDTLQRELNQLGDNLEIVQKEVEKVPALELEVARLTKSNDRGPTTAVISDRAKHTINITAPGNEASLRHKVQLLSDRIKSMLKISDFDLESAQELVEIRQQKLDVELRFEELRRKYDQLVK